MYPAQDMCHFTVFQYLKALAFNWDYKLKVPLLHKLHHVFKYLQWCHSSNVDNSGLRSERRP